MKRRQFIQSTGLGLASLAFSRCQVVQDKTPKPPNFLVIVTDDQRLDALGCAGNPILKTPNMDRLAAEGIRFDRAFATTPICAASRASIFTGLYERSHQYTFSKPPVRRAHTDISYPVLLRQAGYRTGFIGKFGVMVEEGVEDQMFDWSRMTGFPYFQEVDGEKRHMTDVHGDMAAEFLRESSPDQPFCLSLSFRAPHAHDQEPKQYFWPPSSDGMYDDVDIPVPETADPAFFEAQPDFLKETLNRKRWYWRFDTPEKYQEMVKGYYRMITGVDRVIGNIIKELKDLGLYDNTVIVLLGDNGYYLGERGFAGKWLMHDLSIRIPLIVFDPRVPAQHRGLVKEEMALNVDLAPTFLEMAGLDVPDMMQGESLVPLIEGKRTDWRQEVLCEHLWDKSDIPLTECIRTDRWKYIRYMKHPEFEELYDLSTDPQEKINLAEDPAHTAILNELRERCSRGFQTL